MYSAAEWWGLENFIAVLKLVKQWSIFLQNLKY